MMQEPPEGWKQWPAWHEGPSLIDCLHLNTAAANAAAASLLHSHRTKRVVQQQSLLLAQSSQTGADLGLAGGGAAGGGGGSGGDGGHSGLTAVPPGVGPPGAGAVLGGPIPTSRMALVDVVMPLMEVVEVVGGGRRLRVADRVLLHACSAGQERLALLLQPSSWPPHQGHQLLLQAPPHRLHQEHQQQRLRNHPNHHRQHQHQHCHHHQHCQLGPHLDVGVRQEELHLDASRRISTWKCTSTHLDVGVRQEELRHQHPDQQAGHSHHRQQHQHPHQ